MEYRVGSRNIRVVERVVSLRNADADQCLYFCVFMRADHFYITKCNFIYLNFTNFCH